jgi:hypothetical protein
MAYQTTKSFTLSPPKNTASDYKAAAQDYANQVAMSEEQDITLIATYTDVRDPESGDSQQQTETITAKAGTIESTKETAPNTAIDNSGSATDKATQNAAISGSVCTVTVTDNKGKDTTVTVQPPPRPKDLLDKVSGKPATTPSDPTARTLASAAQNAEAATGSAKSGDELDNSSSPGMSKDQLVKVFNGAQRQLGGIIPSLEGIMMNIPQAALGKFTSLLPPAFKSLLPIGSIPGLNSKGPVSLSGLTNLVAGAALGQVAGQALRSLTGGPAAVSGLTGALGAQAVARVSGSTAIPVNIASTFGNALLSNVAGTVAGNLARNALGSTPATAGVIANVVGIVTNVALNQRSGVPVNSQVLGLAANVALRSAGVPTSIPTSVLGLASSSAMNPIAAMIGGSVSGRIPVLPGNLSLPNVGALSGLSQNLSPGLAENLIPPNQLQGLLPGNLQAQIPGVPPRVSSGSPYTQNSVGAARAAAKDSSGPVESNPNIESKDALAKGAGGANVDYGMKISEHYTLGDFCITTPVTPNRKLRPYAPEGLSVDQLIENLSWLAVNLIEPIRAQFPGFTLNGGYDYPGAEPGSKRAGKSRHFYGSAMDLQWRGDMRDFQANKNRAVWIAKNLPIRACILEAAGKGIWIHVDGRKIKEGKYLATHSYWKEIARDPNPYVDPL